MLDGEEALRYCLKNEITIEQFFILYLLSRNDFQQPDKRSVGKTYIAKMGMFKEDSIRELIRRGFIENFNSPGYYYPEMFMLTPATRQQFMDSEMAEELWDKYPLRFPLGTSWFIARAGGDKDELLELYLKKINHSTPKHQFVMAKLATYEKMVMDGKINGYKIGDWIRQELWDTISGIDKLETSLEKGDSYGKDI